MSMPGPAPSVYSPFCRCGMPQANSITSSPRWTSPRESASTLPCSVDSIWASSSMCFSTRPLKLNMTRARRCGLTLDQAGNASSAASTALRISDLAAKGTRAWTSPVEGLKTSPKRPPDDSGVPLTCRPAMKWVSSFMRRLLDFAAIHPGAVLALDAVEREAGLFLAAGTGGVDVEGVLAVDALSLAAVAAFGLAGLGLGAGQHRALRQRAELERAGQRRRAELVVVRFGS